MIEHGRKDISQQAKRPSAEPLELKAKEQEDSDPVARLEHRVLRPIKNAIFRPLNRRLDKLGYVTSLFLFLAITGVSALTIWVWNNFEEASRTVTVIRFYWDARRLNPPRTVEVGEVVRALTNRLMDQMSSLNRSREGVGAWSQAQMVVSLQGKDAFDPAEMADWFARGAKDCRCWREGSDPSANFGASGWVLLAFARMRRKPPDQSIELMLSSQRRPGWWPMFASNDEPRNASIYATALETWGLSELLAQNLVSQGQKERVYESVRKGRSWLLNNSVAGKPGRWKDYPNGEYDNESIGVSGLALHVLHRVPGDPPVSSDHDWMLRLPIQLPLANDEMSSGEFVHMANQSWHGDVTHNFSLPWLIIATLDAFPQGTLSQKAQAVRLLHQIPEEGQDITEQTRNKSWLGAETLIALRYLQGDDVI